MTGRELMEELQKLSTDELEMEVAIEFENPCSGRIVQEDVHNINMMYNKDRIVINENNDGWL